MKHLKPHLILESSNKLTKEYLDRVFSQLGVDFRFIPGRKEYQLAHFEGRLEEYELPTSGNYSDYFNEVREFYDFHERLLDCIQVITDEFDNKHEVYIIGSGDKKVINITFYV